MSEKDYSGGKYLGGKNGENVFDKDQFVLWHAVPKMNEKVLQVIKSEVTEARSAEGTSCQIFHWTFKQKL